MKKSIKSIIQKTLKKFGFKIQRIKSVQHQNKPKETFNMIGGLRRCYSRGLKVETVIDVGASDGRWSGNCMKIFPNAAYLLVEAQDGHKEGLDDFTSRNANTQYVLAAAGPEDGTIYFDSGDLFSGVASLEPLENNCIEVPVVSLDSEIKRRGLKGPYILKLDTHGFEIPILKGASEIIEYASLIIIESYNFRINQDSLRYWEMCSYMDALGFAPIEIVDLMLREYDQALWQMDTFFVPKNDRVFSYSSYS